MGLTAGTNMYCDKCGSDQHFAANCDKKVLRVTPDDLGEPNGRSIDFVVFDEYAEINPEALRKRDWRQRNRERYNAYQRDYMRSRRNGKIKEPSGQ